MIFSSYISETDIVNFYKKMSQKDLLDMFIFWKKVEKNEHCMPRCHNCAVKAMQRKYGIDGFCEDTVVMPVCVIIDNGKETAYMNNLCESLLNVVEV